MCWILSWNQLGDQQKHYLKQQAMALCVRSDILNTALMREKVASITSRIANREWPQRWPELLERLFQAAQRGLHAQTVVLLVLRNMGEETIAFNPHLPELRRQELQRGLLACMENVFPFFRTALRTSIAALQDKAANEAEATESVFCALDVLTAYLDWMPVAFIFGTGLLSQLCSLLPAGRSFVLRVVPMLAVAVATRKTSSIPIEHHK